MKQYVIDELRPADHGKLKEYLDQNFHVSGIPGLYWIWLEEGLLTEIQRRHSQCRPHYLAVELEENRVTCEFLVRSRQKLRCNCIGYADARQRIWLMELMDAVFQKLAITT